MKVFLTQEGVEGVDEKEINAIDIISDNYNISIRIGGILIKQKNKDNQWIEVEKIDLDLGN